MKAPSEVTFAFDPDQCDIPVLADSRGRILWACIRTQHIVSQHFNGNVQDVALRLEEKKPTTYEAFRDIIQHSGLQIFGIILEESGLSFYRRLDDEFWGGVWDYISGKRTLVIHIEVAKAEGP